MLPLRCLLLVSGGARDRGQCGLGRRSPQPGGCFGQSGCSLVSGKCCPTLITINQKEVQLNNMNLSFIFCRMEEVKDRKSSGIFLKHYECLHMKQTS